MRKLYVEGVATHDDPKPCVGAREDVDEASVGTHVGRQLSHEMISSGCRRC